MTVRLFPKAPLLAAAVMATALAGPAALAPPATAAEQQASSKAETGKAELSKAETGEWVRLAGAVESMGVDEFTMTYGDGTVTVLLDDIEWGENALPVPGDRVEVAGRIERSFFDKRIIDARSVYLTELDSRIYSAEPGADGGKGNEEGATGPASDYPWEQVSEGGGISITGRVDAVKDEMLALDTGYHTVVVDTTEMVDSPVDKKLVQTIGVGDRISVTGEVDHAKLFEGRKVVATTVYQITDRNE